MLLLWSASSAKPALYAAWVGLGVAQAMTFYDAGFAALTRRLGGGAPRAIMRMTLLGGFAGTVFIPLTGWLVVTGGGCAALIIRAAKKIPVDVAIPWATIAGAQGERLSRGEGKRGTGRGR